MFILKKIFQLRDKAQNNEAEKPFLEHLEDLRSVVAKIALVLFISFLACFCYKNQLMDIILKPIEDVWKINQGAKIPSTAPVAIDLETWELAKQAALDTAMFTPEQRNYYFNHLDPENTKNLQFHTDCIRYYQAAIDIEKSNASGEKFIQNIPGISDQMREQLITFMDETMRPDATAGSQGAAVKMQSLSPTEGFMLSIKLAFFAGIIISFPFLLLFTLQFILPGLKENEKRALWPALAIGFGLFLMGVLFSYHIVLPKVLEFFENYSGEMGIENDWRIGYYITFATQFTLIFGLSFELPVVVMTMVKIGILNYQMMRNTRSYAILAIVILAAVITPTPDAFTLTLLAGPMIVLYEICIWLAYFDHKKQLKTEKSEYEQRILSEPTTAPMALSREEDDDENCDYENDHDDYHDTHHEDDNYHGCQEYQNSIRKNPHEASHEEGEGAEEDLGSYDFTEEELEAEYDPEDYHASLDKEPSDIDQESPFDKNS